MENSDKVIDGLQLIFVELPKFTPHIGYEKFWDIISVEKTLYYSAEQRGLAKGIEKGIAEGIEKGLAETTRNRREYEIFWHSTGYYCSNDRTLSLRNKSTIIPSILRLYRLHTQSRHLLLPTKVSLFAQIYVKEHGGSMIDAIRKFYHSKTYKKLENESTKL